MRQTALLAFAALALFGSTGQAAPIADQPAALDKTAEAVAMDLIEQAVRRVVANPDKYSAGSLGGLAETAAHTGPGNGVRMVRLIANAVEKNPLPAATENLHVMLAGVVVQRDRPLRDEMLRAAVKEGRQAAAEEALWNVPEEKGVASFGPSLKSERKLLLHRIGVWEGVLLATNAPEHAKAWLIKAVEAAKKDGYVGGDVPVLYEELALKSLAGFEPEMLMAIWPSHRTDAELGRFCFNQARARGSNPSDDRVAGFFARAAVEHGYLGDEALTLLVPYDRDAAVAAARRLQDQPNLLVTPGRSDAYDSVMKSFVVKLAAISPDLVYELADREKNEKVQFDMWTVYAQYRQNPTARLLKAAAGFGLPKEQFDPAAVREVFRTRSCEDLVMLPGVTFSMLKSASQVLPPPERLAVLGKCLTAPSPGYGSSQPLLMGVSLLPMFPQSPPWAMEVLGEIVAVAFEVDRETGMKALDAAMAKTRPADYASMFGAVARTSPEAFLKLYKAAPLADRILPGRLFATLAEADPDLALSEARKLPEVPQVGGGGAVIAFGPGGRGGRGGVAGVWPVTPLATPVSRDEALSYVVEGIARKDPDRARGLLVELSQTKRQRVERTCLAYYVAAHPQEARQITGLGRLDIFRAAGATLYAKRGAAGLDELVSGLCKSTEAGAVLFYVAEREARSGHTKEAIAMLDKIEIPIQFAGGVCRVVNAMIDAERLSPSEIGLRSGSLPAPAGG
jgi:hypothetical protein